MVAQLGGVESQDIAVATDLSTVGDTAGMGVGVGLEPPPMACSHTISMAIGTGDKHTVTGQSEEVVGRNVQ